MKSDDPTSTKDWYEKKNSNQTKFDNTILIKSTVHKENKKKKILHICMIANTDKMITWKQQAWKRKRDMEQNRYELWVGDLGSLI